MTPRYNLLDEPWIPLRTPSGGMVEAGLRDALCRAWEYEALAEPSPANLVALYRLLLALFSRCLIEEKWDRAKWWRDGLPKTAVITALERLRDRFWVFHPEMPFMQASFLATAEKTKDRKKSWTQLALEKASGATPVLFDHSMDNAVPVISTGSVVRSMLGHFQFQPGGLIKVFKTSDKSGPLANTAAVILLGKSLHETLLLSLHRSEQDDLPAWEQEPPTLEKIMGKPTFPKGRNDLYTRLTRSVLLLPDDLEGRTVRFIRYAEGAALAENPNMPEPMAAYVQGKASRFTLAFREERAFWRDLPALLPDPGAPQDLHPRILDDSMDLLSDVREDCPLTVTVSGLTSDHAKLVRWATVSFALSRALLDRESATLATLRHFILQAEETSNEVRKLAENAFRLAFPRSKEGGRSLPASLVCSTYLATQLPELLKLLSENVTDPADMWTNARMKAARRAWDAVRDALGSSLPVIVALAKTEPKFEQLLAGLKKQLSEPGETGKGEP